MAEKKIAFAGPWIGEFGWEIMTWAPYLRKLSRDYDKMYISTFPDVEALYTGFHCEVEFLPHDHHGGRNDNWVDVESIQFFFPGDATKHIEPIKEYRIDGEYVRYGSPIIKDMGALFHARGIAKGAYKNWPRAKWEKLAESLPGAICIGTGADLAVSSAHILDADLDTLMGVLASAKVVIGQSSGVMHLAVMCGTPVVTWGNCNNFGESLRERYEKTWNPFKTSVTWIGDTWDPEPEQILEALKPKGMPVPQVLNAVKQAADSGQYIVAVAYMGKKGGKDVVFSESSLIEFPPDRFEQAKKQITQDVDRAIAGAIAERTPPSWR